MSKIYSLGCPYKIVMGFFSIHHLLHTYPPTSYLPTYPSYYLGPCCKVYNFTSAHFCKLTSVNCQVSKWTHDKSTCTLSHAHWHVFKCTYTLPHACCQFFRCTLACFQMHIVHCHMHVAKFSSAHCQVVNCILASF